MIFYSLNNTEEKSNFKEAIFNSLASDGGLYFPERINKLSLDFLNNISNYNNYEIGYEVMKKFVDKSMNSSDLADIIQKTLNFDFKLYEVEKNIFSFELFHGPTLAFKDVGANFLANCLEYYSEEKILNILVATSGDTGAAVANSFYNKKNINVYVLFPKNKISDYQERQITSRGNNIYPIEIEGNFDDCQSLVKRAFKDKNLRTQIRISSANSINIGRWLPQSIYYFILLKELSKININNKINISVPSGNFGNICAGLIAMKMGLNVNNFIAATNINDTIPRYLKTGNYKIKKTIRTISNAMDVSDPNNFPRIEHIFDNNFQALKNKMYAEKVNEEETKNQIKKTYCNSKYVLDPHGAVGLVGLRRCNLKNEIGIFLETAHPIKFRDSITEILNVNIDDPLKLTNESDSHKIALKNNYSDLIEFIKQSQ